MDAFTLQIALFAALLSAPSFDTRERATRLLESTPPPIVFALAHHRDPEVRHRARPFAAELVWREIDAEWSVRQYPWVDAIEGQPWQGIDLPHVDAPYPHQNEDWPNYREATRLWAKWQVKAGTDPAVVRAMLIEAEKRCEHWRKHRTYP